jgi:hypothetical protein
MSHPLPIFSLSCLTVALTFALAACGTQAPPKADTPSVEQRLFDLERRMERLEARPAVQPAYRTREEIQAHIKSLEEERARLLVDFHAQHPAIRDIDRRLEILNVQLRLLE